MNHRLENRRALVTCGSHGIGAAIVIRLARDPGPRGVTINNM
jgi:NAD(P)-dependent dehydrogenase (short-subunit alcohol dehydrogenase family)